MAGFARTELDLLGLRPPGQPGGRPALRDPRREAPRAATSSCSTRCARRPTTRCSRASSEQYYAARELHPARGPRPGRAQRCRRRSRRSWPSGAPGRCTCASPGAARSASSWSWRSATPPRPWPASRRAGWPTRADARRARGARRGARPAGSADAHRVLRHQHVPGRPVGRQHGRLRGGPAADRRVPPLPGPDGPGPERLRQPPGGAPAPLPPGEGRRRGQRRGAALAAAGPRDHRRRQGPGRGGQGRPRRARPARPAARRAGQGARGAVPARRERPDPAAGDVAAPCTSSSACATRRTGSRSPTTATCGPRRRSARRSTTCPASGPKRKRALLRVFGSAKRVREAPVEQIAAVPGIGPRLAATIKETLEA